MMSRKNIFMDILNHLIITEASYEAEVYSNMSPYIDDLDKVLALIMKIRNKDYYGM